MKTSLFLLIFGFCITIQAQEIIADPIEIIFDGSSATVNIPADITDVNYIVDDADVQIISTTTTTEYTYHVSGTSSNGSLTINGIYKLTLELAGVNLTKPNGGAAIDVECGKRTDLVLVEGTVNRLMDSEFGTQKGALYFKGHADFKGGGILYVTGKRQHAICANEEMELKSSLGTINVLGAVKDGIHCGKGKIDTPDHNYFQMDGGTVNITHVGSDGIESDDYGSITINGGALSINVSAESSDGIKADKDLIINGGDITINVYGEDSEGIKATNRITLNDGNINIIAISDGSKGIKAKRETENATILNGGYLDINGGYINIYVSGDSYQKANGSTSNCMAISVDADMTQSGGDIVLTAMGSETKGYNVKGTNTKTGGTLKVTHGPWKIDSSDLEFDMSIYVRVYKNGEPVTDYSNIAVGAFIWTECMGLAEFDQTEWGMVRVHYDSTDNDEVYFKLYDNAIGREFDLTADREILFDSQGLVGTPSNPVILNYEMTFTPGDVNMDGLVDVADITALAYHIFGTTPTNFDYDAADANNDGDIDVADITAISYMIFSQNAKPRKNQLDPQ
ncbi:MAG: carbohydrate-binding domain-containing protein [Bacteroidaceae bacterium]|nr:carbohydrate-binding domain-containing protein [Bacteroidaceae bacterium]